MAVVGFVLLGLLAAGCGDDDAVSDGDGSGVSGMCVETEPDCDDVGVVSGDDAGDIGSAGSAGMLADGGLTVSEALATEASGVIAVKGFVVADSDGVRLCEALAESSPPQCGGAAMLLAGMTVTDLDALGGGEGFDLESSQGVSWTDDSVSLFGEMVDGDFVVDLLAR
jgi:hypothetical protein